MGDIGVKDTAAYKIVRQILDHTWGSDSKLEEKDFLHVLSSFYRRGGSWERLMDGDMKCVKHLEDSIDDFMNAKKLVAVARQLISRVPQNQ